MRCVPGDVVLGLHGDGFEYLFSYTHGGPVSLVVDGCEWFYRPPRPTFWRATTCNDRGNGFSHRSAMWMGADLFSQPVSVQLVIDGKKLEQFTAPYNNAFIGTSLETPRTVEIMYAYTTPTVPETKVTVSYLVQESGEVFVRVHYAGVKGLPELPVFGLRFILPYAVDGYEYFGLSGETYPDRKAGSREGLHAVSGLPVTPYVIPQDCGMHMDTRHVVLKKGDARLRFMMQDSRPFAFTALPYTALELENAAHHEELPPVRRTVVCILGAVRGVGGINSWGADVSAPYHVHAEKDIDFSFSIGR